MFIPELLEAYPKAKLIVCERPVARWWDSMQRTINRHTPRQTDFLLLLDPELFGPSWSLFRHMHALFGGDYDNEALATAAYRRYHAEARGLVPEGPQRLEFQLGDGWGPLCKFLGKEVPVGVPFPHLNEGADFVKGDLYFRKCAFQRVRARALRLLLESSVLAVIALGPLLFLPKEAFVRFGKYLTWKH